VFLALIYTRIEDESLLIPCALCIVHHAPCGDIQQSMNKVKPPEYARKPSDHPKDLLHQLHT
jgi:hypothetical protein